MEKKMENDKADSSSFKLGLIINPISGMGGSVGLKGTDGKDILKKAIELGAKPGALNRARLYLKNLIAIKDKLLFFAPPGVMGSDLLTEMGFNVSPLNSDLYPHELKLFNTERQDTITSAKELKRLGVQLIVFAGGDGTARDIYSAVERDIPCLGIPTGVKIHSSVFAINPEYAARLTMEFLWGEAPLRESEVLDINEEEFRNNRVVSKLYGYMLTPYSPIYTQPAKMAMPQTIDEQTNKENIAKWIVEEMEEDTLYLIGPGTTTKAIADLLKEKKTLLGVDLMHNKKIIKWDLNERDILEVLKEAKEKKQKVKLIVTPIGHQGFIFGRGNLQISAEVLRELGLENIIIICTKYKLSTIPERKLRADTRNPEMDKEIKGYYRVLVDYGEIQILKLE
ncbi:MAG: ATP-NAD kinase family protein [Promethearchaeota archaeon]